MLYLVGNNFFSVLILSCKPLKIPRFSTLCPWCLMGEQPWQGESTR